MIGQIDDHGGFCEKMFVNKVDDDLICPICQDVLKDPFQGKCGHMHCKSCWDDLPNEFLGETMMIKCTVCSERTALQNLSPCRYSKNCINKFLVKCEIISNSTCDWTGTLSAYPGHKVSCQFQSPKSLLNQHVATLNVNNTNQNCVTTLPTPLAKRIVQSVLATRRHHSSLCSLKLQVIDEKGGITIKARCARRVKTSWSDLFVRLYCNFFPRIIKGILEDALKDTAINCEDCSFKDSILLLQLRDMILYFLWCDLVGKVLYIREFGVRNDNFDIATRSSIVKMSVVDYQSMQKLLSTTLAANSTFMMMVEEHR
jgi:hypothetical protein